MTKSVIFLTHSCRSKEPHESASLTKDRFQEHYRGATPEKSSLQKRRATIEKPKGLIMPSSRTPESECASSCVT